MELYTPIIRRHAVRIGASTSVEAPDEEVSAKSLPLRRPPRVAAQAGHTYAHVRWLRNVESLTEAYAETHHFLESYIQGL